MGAKLASELAAAALIMLLWYLWFARQNRRRACQAAAWVKEVFAGHGEIVAVEAVSPAEFNIRLHTSPSLFRRASVRANLHPRPLPALWLWRRLHRVPETLTFEADFEFPPAFRLEVRNHRWSAWTRGAKPRNTPVESEKVGPFVLTTRRDWQREILNMMTVFVASRECEFLSICFRRDSPHFSACVPLHAATLRLQRAPEFFEVLRELASCGSAFRF